LRLGPIHVPAKFHYNPSIGFREHYHSIGRTDKYNEVTEAQTKLKQCITAINDWMTSHKLKLNAEKKGLLVVRPKIRTRPVPEIKLCLSDSVIRPSSSARIFSVVLEEDFGDFILQKPVTLVCRSDYFKLRTINSLKQYLPKQAIVTVSLERAFIMSRLILRQ
jgi:nitroreductase